jgi:primosomal protein N' (replication factor Y)
VKRVPVLLPYPLRGPFDYRVPAEVDAKPGDVVLAPLNGREEMGVVWDTPPDAAVPDRRLKPLIGKVDTPPMRPELRRFIDWMASYTLAPPGEVMAMALRVVRAPRGARPNWRARPG